MKKYLGILKINVENMSGFHTEILTKFYEDKSLLEKWFLKYPNHEHIILENNKVLDLMFKEFEDVLTPITDEEKNEIFEAEESVKILLKSKNNLI